MILFLTVKARLLLCCGSCCWYIFVLLLSDRQGSNFESCVWRTVSSQSSHHTQEVLLAQFSLYVHKGGLKPDSFHFFGSTSCVCWVWYLWCVCVKLLAEKANHFRKYSWLRSLSIATATGNMHNTRNPRWANAVAPSNKRLRGNVVVKLAHPPWRRPSVKPVMA